MKKYDSLTKQIPASTMMMMNGNNGVTLDDDDENNNNNKVHAIISFMGL